MTSIGTGTLLASKVLWIGGISLALGGVAIYYLMKSKREDDNDDYQVIKILSDDDRYKTDKMIIEEAIMDNDIETLEDMLHSSTSDFPDLVEMIEEALVAYNENKR